MSITDLKALGESWEMGERKLPAAPALWGGKGGLVRDFGSDVLMWVIGGGWGGAYMQKSMPPSSLTQVSTALSRLSGFRTSIEPIPSIFEP